MYEHDDEALELIQRIVDRDERAMLAFYDRYFGLIAGFCRKFIGDRATADEVIQDTFWQVWQSAARYDPQRARITAWLLIMARSRCLDALRKLGRAPETQPLDTEMDDVSTRDPVVEQIERRWEKEQVLAAFQGLPPPQQDVVHKVFLEGWTAQQVAVAQAVPLGTVKTRLRLALHKLRQVLEVDAGGP